MYVLFYEEVYIILEVGKQKLNDDRKGDFGLLDQGGGMGNGVLIAKRNK
jgi:hypothetical protein